jgi:hypothetical protein
MRDYRDEFRMILSRDAEVVAAEKRAQLATELEQQRMESNIELRLLSAICFEILGASPPIQRERIAVGYERYAQDDRYPNVRDVVRKALGIRLK